MKVLCLSRSYLAHLLPTVGAGHVGYEYHHIVQTDAEQQAVEAKGAVVVLNIQAVVRQALRAEPGPCWQEPADFRTVTGFAWSPIHSDRYLPQFPEPLRARIAGALQDAVAALFEKHRYAGFVSEPVALFVTHLLLYHCKKSGTRPLLWATTYFPDYFFFVEAMTFSTPVKRGAHVVDAADLRERVQAFVAGVAMDKAGPVYHHAFSKAPVTRLGYFRQRKGMSALVIRPGWGTRAIQIARLGRAVAKRLGFRWSGDFMTAGAVAEHWFYLRCLFARADVYDAMPTDVSADRAVFPLQFEPEASLLYCAPQVVSQASFVEGMLKALPAGKTLWVKEHPNQFGALGGPEWRSLKRRYSSLKFLHGRASGRDLIKRSGLVLSISSSMGMDALLCGRKVVVIGDVFYRHFDGALPVSSLQDLVDVLHAPASWQPYEGVAAQVEALTAMGVASYPGDPQPSAILHSVENLRRLRQAIGAELT